MTDHLFWEIRRREFYSCLEGINDFSIKTLKNIFPNKSVNLAYKEDFNFILRHLKKNDEFDLIDSITYIEEDLTNMKNIMLILDGESMEIIRKELAKKYHKKIEKSKLEQFLKFL